MKKPLLCLLILAASTECFICGMGIQANTDAPLIKAGAEALAQAHQDNADLRMAYGLPEEAPAVVAVQP